MSQLFTSGGQKYIHRYLDKQIDTRYLHIDRSPKSDSILKSRDITLPTKGRLVKALVFPVLLYGCKSWTVKKLSAKELMLLNCGVGEDSRESLGLQGDPTGSS